MMTIRQTVPVSFYRSDLSAFNNNCNNDLSGGGRISGSDGCAEQLVEIENWSGFGEVHVCTHIDWVMVFGNGVWWTNGVLD